MLYTAVPLALLATEPYLEKDLVRTLLFSALGLNIAQIARAVVSRNSDVYSALLMGVLSLLLTPLVVLVMVAFGAPVISVQQETVLCAAVLSSLVLQPLLTIYGLDAEYWRQMAGLQLPLSDVYIASLGAIVGAWIGVIPIALDWDRTWQTYPITILMGAYVGNAIGQVLGLLVEKAQVKSVVKKSKKSKK